MTSISPKQPLADGRQAGESLLGADHLEGYGFQANTGLQPPPPEPVRQQDSTVNPEIAIIDSTTGRVPNWASTAEGYFEQGEPISSQHERGKTVSTVGGHILNQICNSGFFDSPAQAKMHIVPETTTGTTAPHNYTGDRPMTKLFAAINITSLHAVKPAEERFKISVHLYLIWAVDWDAPQYQPLRKFHDRALASTTNSYTPLSKGEYDEWASHACIPEVKFAKVLSNERTDDPALRVYGGHGGGVMWNAAFQVEIREQFSLHDFPFDGHELEIELRQDNSLTWDLFDLTMCVVQYKDEVLEQAEWQVFAPRIQRGKPQHKVALLFLPVVRKHGYYTRNIFLVSTSFSLMAFVVFAMPASEVGNRMAHLTTLMLTSVAFKFVVGDVIPKVGYSTILDTFLLGNLLFIVAVVVACVAQLVAEKITEMASSLLIALICGGVCVLFLLIPNCLVAFQILIAHRRRGSTYKHALHPTRGLTWYAFNFATPPFLDRFP